MNFIMTMIFILPIIICFFLYHQLTDLRTKREIEKNSYKLWLKSEVEWKRTYCNLSLSLINERDFYKSQNIILKKAIFRYIHHQIDINEVKKYLKI